MPSNPSSRSSSSSQTPTSTTTASSPTSPNVTIRLSTSKKGAQGIYIGAHTGYHLANPKFSEDMRTFTYKVFADSPSGCTARNVGSRSDGERSDVYTLEAPGDGAFVG